MGKVKQPAGKVTGSETLKDEASGTMQSTHGEAKEKAENAISASTSNRTWRARWCVGLQPPNGRLTAIRQQREAACRCPATHEGRYPFRTSNPAVVPKMLAIFTAASSSSVVPHPKMTCAASWQRKKCSASADIRRPSSSQDRPRSTPRYLVPTFVENLGVQTRAWLFR